jgi:DNA polymerase III subunit gamma/tau
MKTESLAVRYRPKSLKDLLGQDHISKQVLGMFKSGKMPASIMLHGPTGLGKTTVARIITRMINCSAEERDVSFAPCGECPSCKMTDHPDVLELNAADSRGIDDVRSLIQQSKNMPQMGKKRIFILDEAQQFTAQAQQVLLKPLEEPSPNTLWIVCTMSPDKVLPAIAKRCLSMQVKPVEPEVLVRRLARIAKREGVDFAAIEGGDKILKTVADFSNGGVRAAIQLLESIVYAFKSDADIDPNTVLTKFLAGGEADLEQAAANLLLAILTNNLKLLVKSVLPDAARGTMSKMRWLLDYLINNSVGQAKFIPYSGRAFAALAKKTEGGVKLPLATLLQVQNLLLEIETKMNSQSCDERVVLMSMLGNFVAVRMREDG